MSGPADIHFHGDSLGMVCGSGGKVLMTTDGGLSWANHPGNGNLTSVEVFTPDRAYVCNNDYFPVFYKGIYPVTVAEREKEGVVVFPNPATDQLNIVCDAGPGQEKERFEIFDLSGKILRTGQVQGKITLDISGLPSGIYGIRLLRKNQVLIRRFVRL
jgi:hypothetical protein